jgi:tetratricopeptide (TPR) repeat protein
MLALAAIGVAAVALGALLPRPGAAVLATTLLGALVAYVVTFRTWLRARRALARGDRAGAAALWERFLGELARRPALRRFGWGLYTGDFEALTWNNLGVCWLGRPDTIPRAREAFARALALDPLYGMPHVNLGLLERVAGNLEASEQHFAEARRLGVSDKVVQALLRRVLARTNAALGR